MLFCLGEVVVVEVDVATCPHQFTRLQVRLLRHHVDEQGIACDVKRHAEENIRRALVELAGEAAIGNVELKERMTGGERHLRQFADVPGGDNHATRIGVITQGLQDACDLVAATPVAPLFAIDRTEVAVRVRPFVPNGNAVFV